MNCGGYLFKLGRSDSNSKESSVWKRGGAGEGASSARRVRTRKGTAVPSPPPRHLGGKGAVGPHDTGG